MGLGLGLGLGPGPGLGLGLCLGLGLGLGLDLVLVLNNKQEREFMGFEKAVEFLRALPLSLFRVQCWTCKRWMHVRRETKWPLKCSTCNSRLAI